MQGYCFGGDTAQTIMRGVGFRFQDLRALFWREFLGAPTAPAAAAAAASDDRGQLAAAPSAAVAARAHHTHQHGEMPAVPPLQQLTQNFRTHAGVLGLANSVVQLMVRASPTKTGIQPIYKPNCPCTRVPPCSPRCTGHSGYTPLGPTPEEARGSLHKKR